MRDLKKITLFCLALIIGFGAFAQRASSASADSGVVVSNGKIYVVMIVVTTILAGLIIYVVRVDRKISKLEKGES